MATSLNKLGILNLALSRSGNVTIASLENPSNLSSEVLRKALLYYDFHYERLLSAFPWSFATKQVAFRLAQRRAVRLRTAFEIPADAVFLWDASPNRRGLLNYGFAYDSSRNYYRYVVASGLDFVFGDGTAEIIGGQVESDSETLWGFYTHNGKIPETNFSLQFVNILVHAIVVDLQMGRPVSPEKLQQSLNNYHRSVAEGMGEASQENRRRTRVERSTTLQVLDAVPY